MDPLLSPNYLTGYFFGLTLELHIFRVVVSLIREYGLLCVKSSLPFTNQILHCVMLAAGCSVKLIRDSVTPLLPFIATLGSSVPEPMQVSSREEALNQVVSEVQAQQEVSLFRLVQLEHLAPFLPMGKETVAAAVLRCLSSINSSIAVMHSINQSTLRVVERCYWVLSALPLSSGQLCDLFTLTPLFIQSLSSCYAFTTTKVLYKPLGVCIVRNPGSCVACMFEYLDMGSELPRIASVDLMDTLFAACTTTDSLDPFLQTIRENWSNFDALLFRSLDAPPQSPAYAIPNHVVSLVRASRLPHASASPVALVVGPVQRHHGGDVATEAVEPAVHADSEAGGGGLGGDPSRASSAERLVPGRHARGRESVPAGAGDLGLHSVDDAALCTQSAGVTR